MNEQLKKQILAELDSAVEMYNADSSFGYGLPYQFGEYMKSNYQIIGERVGASAEQVRRVWIELSTYDINDEVDKEIFKSELEQIF